MRLTLIPDSGATSTATLPIAPFERLSINVAAQFSLNNSRFSVLVDSLGTPGVPIVVDYARYASPGGQTWGAGGASQAIVAPAQTPADTAPTVTATTPANGATNVLLHGNLTVTFSESVSVTPTAFTLQCPVGTPIALTNLTASPGTTFTLDPNVALPQNTICTLTVVANQVTDTDANDPPNNMAANHVITFTTETESAPTVTATTPANGATGVTVGSNLTVTFSEPVNVTAGTFVLECPGGTPIAVTNTTGAQATTFTLDPNVNLPYSTTCTATVVASTVTDVDSNDPPDNMAANFVFSFTTEACPTVTVTPTSLPGASTGVAYSQTFSQTGLTGTVTWSLTGTLPTGMTFNTATGELSGTPTQSGSFPITVTATGPGGCSGSVSVTLSVNCPVITVSPNTLPAGTAGTPYSQLFTQVGAVGTVTWSLSGTLPTGMTFNTATGELSGTPTQTGSFPVTVTATDANGCSGFVAVTITINCPTITVSPSTVPAGTTGTPFSQIFTQVGGVRNDHVESDRHAADGPHVQHVDGRALGHADGGWLVPGDGEGHRRERLLRRGCRDDHGELSDDHDRAGVAAERHDGHAVRVDAVDADRRHAADRVGPRRGHAADGADAQRKRLALGHADRREHVQLHGTSD